MLREAFIRPLPIQRRLPILIGGSGPKRTLRTVARFADAWNSFGTVEEFVERDRVLRAHCDDVGRDQAEIERNLIFNVAVRDDPAEARDDLEATLRPFDPEPVTGSSFGGSPAEVAAMIRPYVDPGVQHVVWAFYPPFDLETVGRLSEIMRAA